MRFFPVIVVVGQVKKQLFFAILTIAFLGRFNGLVSSILPFNVDVASVAILIYTILLRAGNRRAQC